MVTANQKTQARLEDPLHLASRIFTKLYSLWVRATYPFASVGDDLSIHFSCDLKRTRAHQIALGNSVYIAKDAWLNVNPEADNNSPAIVLEDGCVIARRTTISARNLVHLEQHVILSPSVLIMDHSHAYEDVTKPIDHQGVTEGGRIRIGQGTWVGQGAAVVCTKGELTIGRNCVIAANSVVTRSYPDYSVISGNPARVVQQFDEAKGAWVLGSSRSAEAEGAKPVLVRQ